MTQTALCPKEGWNVLHLFYRIDYAAWRLLSDKDQLNAKTAMSSLVQEVRAASIRMQHVDDDSVWETLTALQEAGKIRYFGVALGPAIGSLYEGVYSIQRRNPTSLQHIT
jgi:hypothetical protein